jgi:selenide,water dikinase
VSRGAAPEKTYQATLASMKTSNASAAQVMRELGARACTDVTGFGFLGHCWELAAGSGVGVKSAAKSLPWLPSVRELIGEGIIDGSHKMNMNSFKEGVRFEGADPLDEILLYSSETSGGLLIAVDSGSGEPMLERMRAVGLESAAVIGRVVDDHPGVVVVNA